jgi:polyhydroxybutyrate depolymerase
MMTGMPHTAQRCARALVIVSMVTVLAATAGCRRLPAQSPAGPADGQGPASTESGHGPAAGGTAQPQGPGMGDQAGWIRSGGMVRRYLIHLPAGATSAAGLPVVLAFHGRLGTAEGMSRLTHLDRIADEHRFVVVYPQGYRRSWNDGRPGTPAHAAGVNDAAFVAGLIHYLVSADQVDASRVYATGMSNGAIFTERLGCDLTGLLAGIAPVAGPMPVPVAGSCHPSRPIPVLEIHGTADPLVPYNGGQVNSTAGGVVRSVAWTVAFWRAADRCQAGPVTVTWPDTAHDGTGVRVSRGGTCAPGTQVVLYTVTGGGHTWPGGEQYLPSLIIGPTSRQFDASETIWRFFAKLPRP